MRRFGLWLIVVIGLVAVPAGAHDVGGHHPLVIDTDMGLDDAVTLAMALQSPDVNIVAIVACDGVASGENAAEFLERMLDLFNRREIPLYAAAPASGDQEPPSFRGFAEHAVGEALTTTAKPLCKPFSPEAYVGDHDKTVVLMLGPLTNLAAALRAKPEISDHIGSVIVAGSPEPQHSWNLSYDPGALDVVKEAGLALTFVSPSSASFKPRSWREGELAIGQRTSIGEEFLCHLLEPPAVRQHYVEQFATFHDELAFLYLVYADLFDQDTRSSALFPTDGKGLVEAFTRCISEGRQRKRRVVLTEKPLPANAFQENVRRRRASMIAKNGEVEWFAELMTNELHQHLGAYSVIGVKMGLRAAELLNAPQHSMKVTSYTPPEPPVSCLNDGVVVSTGCTPGRMLYTHVPGPPDSTRVRFAYNGREVTLEVKPKYRAEIKSRIVGLLRKHTLEDGEYWEGVRELGLDIWENWHRRDLFDVVDTPAPGEAAP